MSESAILGKGEPARPDNLKRPEKTGNTEKTVKITALRLSGFKSFADPVELSLDRGLTGIVGPNGCGKSNIAEGLRWVMGEATARSMRGAHMQDLIFAGSDTRIRRRVAEVGIDLLEESGGLENKSDITRRLSANGISEFHLNGKPVRARDVRAFFADAATGAESPAIVRQGQVAALVAAKPIDRRKILEDAAGIGGLRTRREEAQGRLRATSANLERIDELCAMLAERKQSLAGQASKARRYRELSHEIRSKEAQLHFINLRQALHEVTEAEKAVADIALALSKAERAYIDSSVIRDRLQKASAEAHEQETTARVAEQQAEATKEALFGALEGVKSEISLLQAALERSASESEREQLQQQEAQEAVKRYRENIVTMPQLDQDQDGCLADLRAQEQAAQDALAEAQSTHDRLTRSKLESEGRREVLQKSIIDLQDTLKQLRHQCASDEQALLETKKATEETKQKIQTLIDLQKQAQQEYRQADSEFEVKNEKLAQAQEKHSQSLSHLAEIEGSLRALHAEYDGLRAMFAQEGDRPIVDMLDIEPGMEQAVAAILGAEATAPLSEDIKDSGWRFLAKELPAREPPTGMRSIPVKMQLPALKRIFSWSFLCEREDGDRLAESLLPGERLVSREGDLWRWDGYRSRADGEKGEAGASLRIAGQKRMQLVQEEMQDKEKKQKDVKLQTQKADKAVEAAKLGLSQARQSLQSTQVKFDDARNQLQQREGNLQGAEARISDLEEALKRDRDRFSSFEQQEKEAREQINEMAASAEDEMLLHKVSSDLADARESFEQARTARRDHEFAQTSHKERQAQLKRELQDWQERERRYLERLSELKVERNANDKMLAEKEKQLSSLAQNLDEANATYSQRRQEIRIASQNLLEARQAEKDAEKNARQSEKERNKNADMHANAQAQEAAARASLKHRQEAFSSHVDSSMEETPSKYGFDADQQISLSRMQSQIEKLMQAREMLGEVNLLAEKDMEKLKTEHDSLVSERDDLAGALKKLERAVAILNKEGRTRLLRAFAKVERQFVRLFTKLFGGGKAVMTLLESDDPLMAGLEIMCSPPGKKLSSLSLLSGGEQTLVATALIFAMFLVNPAPICLLDEVDGPLDDANVVRFCKLLDEMVKLTDAPFVIITHNPITMERMDRLHGVTMGERGVSQLVSVDLGQAIAESGAA